MEEELRGLTHMRLRRCPITQPATPDRVELLRQRYANGLDLYTGRPLKQRRPPPPLPEVAPPLSPNPSSEAASAYDLFRASLRDALSLEESEAHDD